MIHQPIAHGDFSIERTYAAPLAKVFAALSDIELKAKWFIGPGEWTCVRREITFEVGGSEILQGRFPDGLETLYVARFHAIEANERIVYVYDMRLNGRHHSLSLATIELAPVDRGTRLVYTEQVAYLDGTAGAEGIAARERGVGWHLDNMGGLFGAR